MIYTFMREGRPAIGVPAAKFLDSRPNTPIMMPCPRIGELVVLNGDRYRVLDVIHTPQHEDIMAIIHVGMAE